MSNSPESLPIWTPTSWWRPRSELQPPDLVISDFLNSYPNTHANALWRDWLNYHAGVDWDIANRGYWLLIDEAQMTWGFCLLE